MRKLFLAVLLIIPFCGYAQLQISAGDGISFFKPVDTYERNNHLAVKPQNAFNISAGYKAKAFRYGIGYSNTMFKYSDIGGYPFFTNGYIYSQFISNIYLFADHECRIGRSSFYYGVQFGYITGYADIQMWESIDESRYDFHYSVSGFSAGVHAGYSYNIWKGISINAQIAGIYMNSELHGDAKWSDHMSATLYYLPITAGIKYTLPCVKKKKATETTPVPAIENK